MEIQEYKPKYRNAVMSMSIRTITEEVDLENTHYELNFLADLFKKDIYEAILHDSSRRLWIIAEDNKRLYGYLSVRADLSAGYINGLYLEPDLRGKGWADKLLAKAIDFCQKKGLKEIKVSAAHYSRSAIAFYRKHGFKQLNNSEENGGKLILWHFSMPI